MGTIDPQPQRRRMDLLKGIAYNWKGFMLSLKHPRLMALGLLRLIIVLLLSIAGAALVLHYYQDVLGSVWARPASAWLQWLWVLASWLTALMLMGLSTLLAYIVSQLAFAVLIMDLMSRITERLQTGTVHESGMSWPSLFVHLLRQEIPRAIIPIVITLLLTVASWVTPAGPAVTVVTSLAAAAFLAWDNTDLVPARRLEPFGSRFRFFLRHLGFHLGFGLWFLVPVLNIVMLSFAPVGATLLHVSGDRTERADGPPAMHSPTGTR